MAKKNPPDVVGLPVVDQATDPMPAAAPDAPISTAEMRNALQQGQRMFRAFQHADKALALFDNLEQVTREREALAAQALLDVQAAQIELQEAKDALAKAKIDAKAVRAQAAADAEKLAGDAKAAAAEATQTASDAVKALERERDSLVAELIGRRGELSALDAQLQEAQATIAKARQAREALQGV